VRREPLLIPVSSLALGILVAHFFYFTFRDLLFPGILALAIVLVSLVFTSARGLRWAAACTSLALIGIATQVGHRQGRSPVLSAQDGETVLLSGCVIAPTVFSPDRAQFTLELAPRAAIRMSVNLKANQTIRLPYGKRIEAAAKIRFPRNFQNPDAFDYAAYLALQHIYWTGSVASPADIRELPVRCGSRVVGWMFTVRTWALDRLNRLYPGDPYTAGLLQATLLGETSGVERRWTTDFRITGTYHALVISGLHVSVLAFSLLLLLRVFRFRRLPALSMAAAVCWLYAILCGFGSPVVRSAGGFTVFLLAACCFRKTRILNVLAVVGLIYLLLDPDELFDPSFQLSFLSAAAIAAFAIPVMNRFTEPLRAAVRRFDQPRYDPQVEMSAAPWRVEFRLLSETLHLWSGLSRTQALLLVSKFVLLAAFVLDTVIVSACIQFGLALPMASYFHRLSLTGLSANVIVVPLLSLVIPFGFASVLTGWRPLAWLTALCLKWSEAVAGWHAGIEPSWRLAALPLWLSIAFAASLVMLTLAIRMKRAFVAPALGCSLLLFGILCWQPWRPSLVPHELEVTAIDVGQGDSLLVVFPDGETMLVDAGGFPGMERMRRKPQIDIGEDVVSPYLWSRRIRRLDYAVLTHGHSDHMAGLAAVLDNFHPRALWIGAEPKTPEWQTVQTHAITDRVKIVQLHRTSTPISLGGTEIRVLAPSSEYVASEAAQNNDSVVLEITYKDKSVLLTGDAERLSEDDMVNSGQLRPVTLLKIGHHGSRTSSSEEFLDQVRPQLAIISDGYQNQFHHPHPEVLQRLASHHVAVFRTDQRGLITFRTDGEAVELRTFH